MITCGWCHTHYDHWQKNCANCGGPLPPPPGMDPGPEPPEAPRRLPHGFVLRTRLTRNVTAIIGAVFFGAGGLMLLATFAAKTWFALLPGFFALGGLLLFRSAQVTATGILRAFRMGVPVAGKITEVSMDTTTTMNDRHPWRLVYHFPVDGQEHEGVLVSFDSTIGSRSRGQPLWVLYMPDDLEQNTIYPPLR